MNDFHLHTTVSDGLMTPMELVDRCAEVGIKRLSITDHDAVGAYQPEVLKRVQELGMEMTVGIEMDVVDGPIELHMLAFGFDLHDAALSHHLHDVQGSRRQRALEELKQVQALLGHDSVSLEEALPASVQTVMKPHIIRALLARRLFATYREAKRWLKENVVSGIEVAKPAVSDGIQLLHAAGAQVVLAHPGYYCKDHGLVATEYIERLAAYGIDGVEVYYPYSKKDPHLFTVPEEQALQADMETVCSRLGLSRSRGSDCHYPADFDNVYRNNTQLW